MSSEITLKRSLGRWKKALGSIHRVKEVMRLPRATKMPFALLLDYLQARVARYPWDFTDRAGCSIRIEDWWDVTTVWAVYCRNEYDVHADDRTIIDLGANIGVFAIYAAGIAENSTIHCYEPFPATFTRLLRNVNKNQLGARIRCHQEAVAPQGGRARMAIDEHASVCRRLQIDQDSANECVDVVAVGLDAVLDRAGVESIDFLKMDIEGSETGILLGATDEALGRVQRLSVEIHNLADIEPITLRMSGAGFFVTRRVGHGSEHTLTFESHR